MVPLGNSRTRASHLLASFVAIIAVVAGAVIAPAPASAVDTAVSASVEAASSRSLAQDIAIRPAADLSQFRPGNIISNAVFYDSSTMGENEIATFLRARVPSCQSGYTCLKDFRQDTTTRAADAYCGRYDGASNESSARIIQKVAAACGINPQVLLVTLQKEQGLVTHTWPSDWRYTIAMGQGCPDTAACDTRYYGFFNQVYGAARQFKLYGQSSYFNWYAPGKTWNIQFNPNTSCGSSPVYVENQATANLYYYTPYQPNAAALRAGYGEGDGCSAYGNRNFFNYFSDWFGSLQQPAARLIRGDGDSAVYLVNAGSKYHVRTYEDLLAFQSRLGGVASVSSRYVSALPSAGFISRYVHDARSGTLFLLEADGTRHRLVSAGQIAQFGYDFASYVNLDASLIDSFTLGAEVNDFRRVSNGNDVFLLRDGALQFVQSMEIWRALAQGMPLYAASMDSAPAATIPRGPDALPANALVRERDKPEVYLVGGATSVIYVPSLELAADFGAVGSFVVNSGSLSKFTRTANGLAVAIRCDTQSYLPSAGTAVPVNGLDTTGVGSSSLPGAACGTLKKASTTQAAPLFVSVRGDGSVYHLTQGKLRHVLSYEELVALNGDRPLNLLTWSAATAARIGYAAPVLADRSFVQFTAAPEVYYVEGGVLRHVRSYETLIALAGGRAPSILTVDSSFRSTYTFGSPM